MRQSVLLALLALSACGADKAAQAQGGFSVPDAEPEFRQQVMAAKPMAVALAGDTAAFLEAVQPFGPLDLLVTRRASAPDADELHNTFFGVMGAFAQVDPLELANAFQSGPPCGERYRAQLLADSAEIAALVAEVRRRPAVTVLAAWPKNAYRIGRFVVQEGHAYSVSVSPLYGMGPWPLQPVAEAPDTVLRRRLGITQQEAEQLVHRLRQVELAAIVQEIDGTVRCIQVGAMSDNEAGLLFLAPTSRRPRQGQELPDGRQLVVLEALTPNLLFYISS